MELSRILDAHVPAGVTAGLAVLAAPGGRPEAAWTPPDEAREPAFLIYSITKTILAALVLQLAEDERLSLDDRVARWFPEVPTAITVRHLLNHTAGIPDYRGLRAYHDSVRASPSTPWAFERFAAETLGRALSFAPGTGWGYSNAGYMLLKRIVERTAGMSFACLVAERIARPLGLERTFVAESVGDLASLAPAASRRVTIGEAPVDVRGVYHPGWVSHGVVASTPSDIARVFDALAAGRLVSTDSVAAMTACVPVEVPRDDPTVVAMNVSTPGYGLGVMGEAPRGARWGHSGGGPGYGASAFHAADLGGLSVCAMAASEGLEAVRIVAAVLRRAAER